MGNEGDGDGDGVYLKWDTGRGRIQWVCFEELLSRKINYKLKRKEKGGKNKAILLEREFKEECGVSVVGSYKNINIMNCACMCITWLGFEG